jgi:hypothetical protein
VVPSDPEAAGEARPRVSPGVVALLIGLVYGGVIGVLAAALVWAI